MRSPRRRCFGCWSAGARRQGGSTVFGDSKPGRPRAPLSLTAARPFACFSTTRMRTPRCTQARPWCRRRFAVGRNGRRIGARRPDRDRGRHMSVLPARQRARSTSHYARGFHPTPTAGTYGAACGGGEIVRLSKTRSISASASPAARPRARLQFLVNGAWNKRYQVGAAAMNGVIAPRWRATTLSVRANRSRASTAYWSATRRRAPRQGRRRPRQDL